ncbi:MAG: ATP-grasp domain-containing protein [Planctomycetota bacterium]
MPLVRVVFPTAWDRKQLAVRPPDVVAEYEYEFSAPDDEQCGADFDVLGHVDALVAAGRRGADGVFSCSDYPGATVAAAVGTRLGLASSSPAAILRAAHKGVSRRLQARIVPEATPAFVEFDPDAWAQTTFALDFPCFVKPAKGCFSVLARRVADADDMRAFLGSTTVHDYRHGFLRPYQALVRRYLGDGVDPTAFVAEAQVYGRMATLEGYVTDGEARALGVVDSVQHPFTGSFVAFEYPSSLPAAVQARMAELSCRLALGLGLRWTMFNVEWMWNEADGGLHLIEINPRMCGQFADLYAKVDGVHGHRVAFDLACGREPPRRSRSGAHACAASVPLRVFAPVAVARAPSDADLAAAMALFPDTLVWNEVAAGDELRDFVTFEDGHSHRYGVINLGAPDSVSRDARLATVVERLGYRFAAAAPV